MAAHRLDAPVIRGEPPVPEPVPLDWERPPYAHGLTVEPSPAPRVDRETGDGVLPGSGDGARVVRSPGRTDGSIAVHPPRHGVLFTGDCAAGVGRVVPGVFRTDREPALESFRRLAAPAPAAARPGHGDPLTDGTAAALRASADRDSGLQIEHG
ncbi:hypothetical protein GCM10010446_20340 [Streptomyces enissocaesilis]|uniref:Metallo-beta-lactamase domain-containing protein n=1 Tax=Streptomyces enissocaesilis TaxID=332589 RepID=A0ABN3X5C3_9ACTN